MPGVVNISNLRSIGQLEFELPTPGVWLLTAGNGAGKTTLLACLRRIGYPNAFPVHFPVSFESDSLDNPSDSRIIYRLQDDEVEYAYRGERWSPRPRRNSHLLSQFGYPAVIYLGANAERITPRPEDLAPRKVRPAAQALINAANRIFESRKFNELKVMNVTTGGGNKAYLLRVSSDPVRYHSEKNFSLGELCIIKLVEGIRECPNQSLVLIDELEMALHPRAQVQLYRYLEEIARQKRLTVIFSTHSVSLLKVVPRSRIIYLDKNDNGVVNCVRGCFPTFAIGNITLGEERAPDVVLYVEDEVARNITEPLVKLSLQHRFAQQNLFPDVRVVPIGGFDAVVQFLSSHGSLLPDGTKAFALLDADVRTETVTRWQQTQNYARLADFQRVERQLGYLPWTPELGIVENFQNDAANTQRVIRDEIGRPGFSFQHDIYDGLDGLHGSHLRSAAKRSVARMADQIAQSIAVDRDRALQIVCQVFAKMQFSSRQNEILDLILPKVV